MSFLGGILDHARGMTAVCAPTVNAYKRFIAQELGPYFVDWGTDNRSVGVRIPAERGQGGAARVALRRRHARAPTSASAAHIFAGVDGVERGLDPGPPTERGLRAAGRAGPMMPFSLGEALDALEADDFIRAGLGEQFVQAFTADQAQRVAALQLAVTDWELREYARRALASGWALAGEPRFEGPARKARGHRSRPDAIELFGEGGLRPGRAGASRSTRGSHAPPDGEIRLSMAREGRVFGGTYALEISTGKPVLPRTRGVTARGKGVVKLQGIEFRGKRGDAAGRELAARLAADEVLVERLSAVHFEQIRVDPDGRAVIRHLGGSLVWIAFPPLVKAIPLVPDQVSATIAALAAFAATGR